MVPQRIFTSSMPAWRRICMALALTISSAKPAALNVGEMGGHMAFYPVAHRNNHVQIVIIQLSPNIPLTLPANCQIFFDSCLRLQLAFFINAVNMVTYILLAGPKQLSHQGLCQPNGFILQTHIKPYLTVFSLIQQELSPGFSGRKFILSLALLP